MKSIYAILAITFVLIAAASAQDEDEQYRKYREAVLSQHLELRETSDIYNGELSFLVNKGCNDPECSIPIVTKYELAVDALIDAFICGTKTAEVVVYKEIVVTPIAIEQLQRCLVEDNGGTRMEARNNYFDSHWEEANRFSNAVVDCNDYIRKNWNSSLATLATSMSYIEDKVAAEYLNDESTIDEIGQETIDSLIQLKEEAQK